MNSSKTLVTELTSENFETEASASSEPIFIDFWAPWCMPCRMAKPQVEELAGRLAGKVKVMSVNVDQEPGLADAFNVRGIPMFALLEGRKVVDSFTGFAPAAAMEQRILGQIGLKKAS
jgi:thioredoxin 1